MPEKCGSNTPNTHAQDTDVRDEFFDALGQYRAQIQEDTLSSTSGITLYSRAIRNIPLLTAEEEVEHAKNIEAGLYATNLLETDLTIQGRQKEELQEIAQQGAVSKARLIVSSTRLVFKLALRKSDQAELLDLIQEGNVALIHAVEKFDYTRGCRFSTYASRWILEAVNNWPAKSRIIPLARHANDTVQSYIKNFYALQHKLGHIPSVAELAEAQQLTAKRVLELESMRLTECSLDEKIHPAGPTTLNDILPSDNDEPSEIACKALSMRALEMLLARVLTPREVEILSLRYGFEGNLPHSQSEIAQIMGLSTHYIGRKDRLARAKLEKRGRLRNLYGNEND